MYQLERLRELKKQIYKIAEKNNTNKVYVFGSCARKEETPNSDIDFLVEFNSKATLFDQVALQLDLTDILGCNVNIIPPTALQDPKFGITVKIDMVAL